jgi:hypothetical protein
VSSDGDLRARYRFDPHDEGIWLGLGLPRLALVCGALLLGAIAMYSGDVLLALGLTVLAPPVVLARWEGLPLVAWLPLRLFDRLNGAREWSDDPERLGYVTPHPSKAANSAAANPSREGAPTP